MGRLKDWLIGQMEADPDFREKTEIEELNNPEPVLPPDVSMKAEEWQEAA